MWMQEFIQSYWEYFCDCMECLTTTGKVVLGPWLCVVALAAFFPAIILCAIYSLLVKP